MVLEHNSPLKQSLLFVFVVIESVVLPLHSWFSQIISVNLSIHDPKPIEEQPTSSVQLIPDEGTQHTCPRLARVTQ
jgi:hypothetical protein